MTAPTALVVVSIDAIGQPYRTLDFSRSMSGPSASVTHLDRSDHRYRLTILLAVFTAPQKPRYQTTSKRSTHRIGGSAAEAVQPFNGSPPGRWSQTDGALGRPLRVLRDFHPTPMPGSPERPIQCANMRFTSNGFCSRSMWYAPRQSLCASARIATMPLVLARLRS